MLFSAFLPPREVCNSRGMITDLDGRHLKRLKCMARRLVKGGVEPASNVLSLFEPTQSEEWAGLEELKSGLNKTDDINTYIYLYINL